MNFLRKNNQFVIEKDIIALIRNFDLNGDGKLSYTEFMNLVLAQTVFTLRNTAASRSAMPSFSIHFDVEIALLRVIIKELDGIRAVEWKRRDLELRYDFNHQRAFRTIDSNNSGFITSLEMQNFL